MNSPISAKSSISAYRASIWRPSEAENGPVQVDIIAPAEFRVEARAQLEQRRNAPVHGDVSRGGMHDAGHHLQQGALARSVFADNTESFTALDVEIDIAQRPKIAVAIEAIESQQLLETPGGGVVDGVALGNSLEFDGVHDGRNTSVTEVG